MAFRLGLGLGLSFTTSGTVPILPSIRGSQTSGARSNPALPTNLAGDILAVWGGFGGIVTASGWTRRVLRAEGGAGAFALALFTKTSAGGETNLSPSVNPTSAWVAVAIQNATAVDVVGPNSGSDASPVAPSVTPTGNNDLLIDCILATAGVTTPNLTMPGSETPLAAVPDGATASSIRLGWKYLSGTSPTGTRTGGSDQSVDWATATLTIK